MGVVLPEDVLHLICIELWRQGDFDTLFHCAVSSKQLAPSALACLYRMHNAAPITAAGGDDVEKPSSLRKWALLWRSMILSSMHRTLFPYCRYIRALDLRDLASLFENTRFREDIYRDFFAGDLAKFERSLQPSMRLEKVLIPESAGFSIEKLIEEAITRGTPILEVLSGHVLHGSLAASVPRLPRLQSLELWAGAALANGVESLIRTHCPYFKRLSIYEWLDDGADKLLASFLEGLRANSLEFFEIISHTKAGIATGTALAQHRESLQDLRIELQRDFLIALPALKECTALKSIQLKDATGTIDLKRTQNDVFLEIVAWLKACKNLKDVTLNRFVSGLAIITPVLLENDIHLEKIEMSDYGLYNDQEILDFHQAFGHQTDLRSVQLKLFTDAENVDKGLVEGLCQLPNLRDLELRGVADNFTDFDIGQLARSLTKLEDLETGGYGITDAVWKDIAQLTQLRSLNFAALTRFTVDGLLEYTSRLGPDNYGLALALMNADPDFNLSEEEQGLISEALAAKVQGKFIFVPFRDPDVSEYEEESD